MTASNRHIGLGSMILLGINGIIGSGIFLLPGAVMGIVGHWSIMVYVFVTFLVAALTWCFAQCASFFKQNGGAYIYAKHAFGDFIGFEVGLIRWTVGILSWASIVVGFITALSAIWPLALEEPYRSSIICIMIGSLSFFNIVGVHFFRYLNNVVTVAKIIPLFLFIAIGLFYVESSHYHPLTLETFELESFGAAALMIFYAFGGFETLVVAAGEMQNPQKNLPIALTVVIAFCSSLYFFVQFIALGLLGSKLAHHPNPVAEATQIFIGESGLWFVTGAMLISIGGISVSASFITPRSAVALADDGMVPSWISTRSRFDTPVGAILVTMVLAIFAALFGNFTQLAAISVIARFFQYIVTCLAAIVFNYREKQELSFSKKIQLVIIPWFALAGMGWLLLQATSIQIISGFGVLVVGIPFYYLQRKYFVKKAKDSLPIQEI